MSAAHFPRRASPDGGKAIDDRPKKLRMPRMVVRNNESAARYELDLEDRTATVTYRRKGDVITFMHTEAPPEPRGRTMAARLIAGALEDVRSHGWKVRTICPFVVSYVERHPEVHDLLARDAP
jgi:uncharacterized protein